MADKSEIQWTEATWNPIVGCSIVSPGCTNCYAMKMAARIERMNPGNHYAGTTKQSKAGAIWTGKLALAPEHILTAPLRWKRGRKIFVNSMGDVFHEDAPDEWIIKVFAIMALSGRHTFQVLTKRADRMHSFVTALGQSVKPLESAARELGYTLKYENQHLISWPIPNVWLGVSTERQQEATDRIPQLLQTPAAIRFISAEPLLGPIDLTNLGDATMTLNAFTGKASHLLGMQAKTLGGLDWVIVGGESGPDARSMRECWAQSLVDQCRSAKVPVFMKQLGSRPLRGVTDEPFKVTGAGGNMQEWVGALRHRQFPAVCP